MRAGSFSVRLIAGMNKADRFAPSVPWILFLMGIVFFIMIPRLLLAPLLLRISADLGISYSQASYFFLTSSAGFIAGLFSSGYVAQRLGHKWTIVSSLAAAGLFLVLLSRVRDIGFFHLFLFLDGWAIGLYPGSGITAVSAMAPTIHRGKALAIHECGPNLAFILAPVSAAALAPSIGWRGVMLTFGLCGMALSGLFALYGRAGSGRGQPPNFRNIAELARNRSFWVIAALFSMATIGAMGVYGVLPTYLIAVQRFPERYVNNLIGLSRITAFIAILTAGSLTDRYGFRPVVTVILVTTGLATLILGLAHGRLLVLGCFTAADDYRSLFSCFVERLGRGDGTGTPKPRSGAGSAYRKPSWGRPGASCSSRRRGSRLVSPGFYHRGYHADIQRGTSAFDGKTMAGRFRFTDNRAMKHSEWISSS
jgi:predicted MFS family arabinose efflux permease